MDKFEQFLQENRLKLDVEPLPPEFSNRLQDQFQAKRAQYLRSRWIAAASLLLLLIPGVSLYYHLKQTETAPIENQSLASNQEIFIENPYQSEIENTAYLISQQTVPAAYANLFQDFIIQLEIIARQEEIYQKQIAQNGYTEELKQQIKYNYQLKLLVLQKLQNEITKINHLSKNTNHANEKITLAI